MLKSGLIERIAERNPHLYRQDAEKIVNTILDTITAALAQGDRLSCAALACSRPRRASHAPDAIHATARRLRCLRK